jgi:hypothetical protein
MMTFAETKMIRGFGRALRGLLAAAAVSACVSLGLGVAEARSYARPAGGISVDVGPLLTQGLDGFAEIVRADVREALMTEFAGRLGPGQRLVAVINGLSLRSYVGGESLLYNNDYLDGVVTLIGADGRELATQKILTVLPASYGGAWYIPGGEQRRTAGLAQAFASWARRYIAG